MIRWISVIFMAALLISGCTASATSPVPAQPTRVNLPVIESAVTPTPPKQDPTIIEAPTGQAPTPESTAAEIKCISPAALTPALTEGPYFKSGSPERNSLLDPGIPGTRLTLTGYVLTADCQPVANALLEFWQADANGVYDNAGYTLRGHQFSDENGKYLLETVIPGIYTGRTEHIHFKVQAPGGPVLTSQLFFPDVAENQSDRIFDPSLVLPLVPVGDGQTAEFNFIIALQ
ncbi:MAG TPA: hypothetical protein VN363_07910 [Anaerolineales bacterium]|nr:hypothetical protein [Anaerolineales bacterium]